MGKSSEIKTNVMRILEQEKIAYISHEYPHGKEPVDGVTVASMLQQDAAVVFKTLVARGKSGMLHVFVIPVAEELDLKKAARAADEKYVALIAVKELLGATGYVRGGCSPVGMKRAYQTIFHETAAHIKTIIVSAGKIGYQIETAPEDLLRLVQATTADLVATK